MNRKFLKWGGVTLGLALVIVLMIVISPAVCWLPLLILAPADEPLFVSSDTPVVYALPVSAKIIAQDSTAADFFGDYSYCVSFTLDDAEIDRLIEERFSWITTDGRDLPTEPDDWIEGRLPEEIVDLAQGFGACRNQRLDPTKTYKYLHRRVEGGQERLFVIDQGQKIIYYYRSSW